MIPEWSPLTACGSTAATAATVTASATAGAGGAAAGSNVAGSAAAPVPLPPTEVPVGPPDPPSPEASAVGSAPPLPVSPDGSRCRGQRDGSGCNWRRRYSCSRPTQQPQKEEDGHRQSDHTQGLRCLHPYLLFVGLRFDTSLPGVERSPARCGKKLGVCGLFARPI